MCNFQRSILFALATLSFSIATNAANLAVTLTDATLGFTTGPESPSSLNGTLTGTFNTTTGVVTMDPGTTTLSYTIPVPAQTIFDHFHSNWSTGAGSYAADSFSCAEGTWGAVIEVSFCGGYNFGTNGIDESSVDYSAIPGILTLGGDDVVDGAGTAQGSWYLTDTASLVGNTLTMESSDWNPNLAGVQLIFTAAVPVPAALWLFGSALGLLGWMRRQAP